MINHLPHQQGSATLAGYLGCECETLIVGVYIFSECIYEVIGPRHALLFFQNHVETISTPNSSVMLNEKLSNT